MPHKASDLKIEILGVTPSTNQLTPTDIVSLSALLTFKGQSVKTLFQEIKKSEKDLTKTIDAILLNSALRGHASMATTPVLTFSFQGSKFIDSMMTGIVFSSSLMASGRRTDAAPKDIIYPTAIYKNKQARQIYRQASTANMNFLNYLLEQGVRKDEASKILQYGMVGTGIISLSIESLISFKREYENEKEWMPEEAGMLLAQIEKKLKKLGLNSLWAAREVAPRNIYPYPNIFKDPKPGNLARAIANSSTPGESIRPLLECFLGGSAELLPGGDRNGLPRGGTERGVGRQLQNRLANASKEKDWLKRLLAFRQVVRDYNLAFSVTVPSRVPWRVWGEKKRHRTVPMVVDSIYYSIDPEKTIRDRKNSGSFFSIPPTIKKNAKYLKGWIERVGDSINCYQQLLKLGIKPRDAIFVIPRGIYLNVLQKYDLYNLLFGYYPLRLCSTAEEEMLRLTEIEVKKIKKILQQKNMGWLGKYIAPKCHLIGFCPEKNFCSKILKTAPGYNLKAHRAQHAGLKRRFQERLKKIPS